MSLARPIRIFFRNTDASYNETFLALSIAYAFTPAFRRQGIDCASQVPSFQQKLSDLRILIQVLDQTQTDGLGIINRQGLRGGGGGQWDTEGLFHFTMGITLSE